MSNPIEDIDIRCPWCKVINEEIYDFKEYGAKRCCRCKKWFEWRAIKTISYISERIIQNDR